MSRCYHDSSIKQDTRLGSLIQKGAAMFCIQLLHQWPRLLGEAELCSYQRDLSDGRSLSPTYIAIRGSTYSSSTWSTSMPERSRLGFPTSFVLRVGSAYLTADCVIAQCSSACSVVCSGTAGAPVHKKQNNKNAISNKTSWRLSSWHHFFGHCQRRLVSRFALIFSLLASYLRSACVFVWAFSLGQLDVSDCRLRDFSVQRMLNRTGGGGGWGTGLQSKTTVKTNDCYRLLSPFHSFINQINVFAPRSFCISPSPPSTYYSSRRSSARKNKQTKQTKEGSTLLLHTHINVQVIYYMQN